MISTKYDPHPDHRLFRRDHTGDIQSTAARTPLWPILALGLGFMAMGAILITGGSNAGVALGGAAMAFLGLGLVAWFGFLLGRPYAP